MRRLLVVLPLLALAAACSSSAPATAPARGGATPTADVLDPFGIGLGDCVEQPVSSTEQVEEVEAVKAVPCSTPHDGEVYAMFDLPDGAFPGDEQVATAGEDRCATEFEAFVGKPYEQSRYDITSLFPTRESWEARKDREYVCIVVAPDGEQVTGSLKGRKG